MKMKNALAVAAIGTLAAAGSLTPAQTIMPETQVGYAIGSLGTKLGWWPAYDGYTNAATSASGALMVQAAGAAVGASGGKIGAAVGMAGGPVGMLIGVAVGAV